MKSNILTSFINPTFYTITFHIFSTFILVGLTLKITVFKFNSSPAS